MSRKAALLPLLAGFFVMGFGDIIGTVMNQVKAECAANADSISWLMPVFAYVWFLVISIPAGVLAGRIGRRNTVLVSLAATAAAMVVPLFANSGRWYLYVVAFALVGIGNTVIQAALPALMSNVVEPSQLASRISLGQFVKALCAALTPVFVYVTAAALGNWKLLFPLYGALTAGAALWLRLAKIPDERVSGAASGAIRTTTFGGCFAMLREPYVAAMTAGILFSVGADVGFSVAIPEYLKNVFKVDVDLAGMGPTVYFVAKTAAAFAGAVVFAKVSAAKCFPWCMGIGLAATAAIPFVATPFAFLAVVAFVALLTANSFGMCMGLAIERFPAKANEISSLMVMAIVGGGVVSALLGVAQSSFGPVGIVATLGACIAYLFALGLFASSRRAAH
ncbi:MAG: MFS transporter [Kiritimatiellae bacterium]|nr:MFS transporter [Kiritimatiellia bacterium]